MAPPLWIGALLLMSCCLSLGASNSSVVIFQLNGTLLLNHSVPEFSDQVLRDLDAEAIGILSTKINVPLEDYDVEIVSYRTSKSVTVEAVYQLNVKSSVPIQLNDLNADQITVQSQGEQAPSESPADLSPHNTRTTTTTHVLPDWIREDRTILIIIASTSGFILFLFIVIIACCIRLRQLSRRVQKGFTVNPSPRSHPAKMRPVKGRDSTKRESEIISMYVQKQLRATKDAYATQSQRPLLRAGIDNAAMDMDSTMSASSQMGLGTSRGQYPSADTVLTGISEIPESRPLRHQAAPQNNARVQRSTNGISASFAGHDVSPSRRRRNRDDSPRHTRSSVGATVSASDISCHMIPGNGNNNSNINGNMNSDSNLRTSQVRLSSINLEEAGQVRSYSTSSVWPNKFFLPTEGSADQVTTHSHFGPDVIRSNQPHENLPECGIGTTAFDSTGASDAGDDESDSSRMYICHL